MKKERRDAGKGSLSEQRQRSRRAERLLRSSRKVLAALLVVAVAGSLWYFTGRERRAARDRLGDAVVTERSLGRAHVPSTTAHPAPTSGSHSGAARCGVLPRPLGADSQIHSLEHGSVLFQYREADVGEDAVEALAQLAREFGSHVTVAPNPHLSEPFVATAWLRRMVLPSVDLDRARDFAIAFRDRGPERVDCDV